MATKKFLHDLDLGQVSEVKGARIQNVTSTDLTSLAGSLGAANRGLIVYNTTDSTLYTWNGSSFNKYAYEVTGDIQFKGIINPSSSSTVVPVSGHQYVVDAAGALSTQGGAITYSPSANVEVGDVVLFTSATTATIMERNLEAATETSLGTIRLSSQAEVDAGVVADEAVTPATLHGYVDPEFAADRARLTTAEAGIATNAADIAAEETRALAAEAGLASDIAAEETARIAAVSAEATARAAADAGLAADIAAEETRALAAEAGLAADIAAEASARAAADSAEASARSTADAGLAADIAAEETRALAAEAGLAADIAAEETRALAAEATLASRATALEARDEVFVYTASVDLTADSALTVSHNLGLTNKDSFVLNCMHNGEAVSVAVASVSVNALTLTSAVALTGLVVSIIGF